MKNKSTVVYGTSVWLRNSGMNLNLLSRENAQPTVDLAGFFVLACSPVVSPRYNGLLQADERRWLQGHFVSQCREKPARDSVSLRDHDHRPGTGVQAKLFVDRAGE